MNPSTLGPFTPSLLVFLAVLAGCSSSQAPPLTEGTGTNPPPGGGGDSGATTPDSSTSPVDSGEDSTTNDAATDATLPPPHDSAPVAPADAPVIFGNDANDFPDANSYDGNVPCEFPACNGCCTKSGICINPVSNTLCGNLGSTCLDCTLDGGTCNSNGACQ